MNDRQVSTRGIEAQQVLDNESYKAAMGALREQVIAQWKACPIRDKEGQTLLLQLAKITDKFEAILRGYVEAGKLAQHKIEIDEMREESHIKRGLRRVLG